MALIVFDFKVLRETDLDNVIWHEIGAAPFYYSCFLGDVIFEVDDVDLSVSWGLVPVFDFAFQMRRIAEALAGGEDQVYSFTESDSTIEFTLQREGVEIRAEYAEATVTVSVSEFSRAAEGLLSKVRH
ncbi:hypothetical protein CSX12_05225 [Microbacterium sp. Y-01]|uniref:hypothetical protein n=1 Tax=Microbacterium sp. Y-01 TaxID=2048898 RepID=UPI000F5E50CA|nr:hypothetical protein [Microbacterium sp. Y-01]AZH77904.1 hypothetical protein CSX12_05225 [Microbacterium sp. Y-01]